MLNEQNLATTALQLSESNSSIHYLSRKSSLKSANIQMQIFSGYKMNLRIRVHGLLFLQTWQNIWVVANFVEFLVALLLAQQLEVFTFTKKSRRLLSLKLSLASSSYTQ